MGKVIITLFDHRLCRLFAVLWMAVIFWLSSLPDIPGPDLFSAHDKIGHFLVYAMLGVFVSRGLSPWKIGAGWMGIATATILVGAYGATDEIHQVFVPGRDASMLDLLFDAMGGFFSSFLVLRYLKIKGPDMPRSEG